MDAISTRMAPNAHAISLDLQGYGGVGYTWDGGMLAGLAMSWIVSSKLL